MYCIEFFNPNIEKEIIHWVNGGTETKEEARQKALAKKAELEKQGFVCTFEESQTGGIGGSGGREAVGVDFIIRYSNKE